MTAPIPIELKLKKASRRLAIEFSDGTACELSAEYLRVHSPSAEVTGHSPSQATLVVGKQSVGIDAVEPVGRYAVRLRFDDGHDSGLFTWPVLYDLCQSHEEKWQRYVERLAAKGYTRDADTDDDR